MFNNKPRIKGLVLGVFAFLSLYSLLNNLKDNSDLIAHASSINYYVDCIDGNDAYDGMSQAPSGTNIGPWKTLAKVKTEVMPTGATISLKRGCEWNEILYINESGTASEPITVKDYGTGNAPTIRVTAGEVNNAIYIDGKYITIRNLNIKGTEQSLEGAGVCVGSRKGNLDGVVISDNGAYTILTNNNIEGFSRGIALSNLSHHNKILNSTFQNNSMMSVLTSGVANDDKGAIAIDLKGDSNEIAYNTISGTSSCSYDYEKIGNALEISSGANNTIHHNKLVDNLGFVNLQGTSISANTFAYNLVRSSLEKSNFIKINLDSNAVLNSRFYNNTVYFSAPTSSAVQCNVNCSISSLTLKNNIIWTEGRIGDSDNAFDEQDNIYWRSDGSPQYNFQKTEAQQLSDNIRKINPLFVNIVGFDFHLTETSPAVDSSAQTDAYNANFLTDLDGKAVPLGTNRDIGAYEFVPVVAPSPSVTAMPSMTPTVTPIVSVSPTVSPTATPLPTNSPIPTVIMTATPVPTVVVTTTPPPISTTIPTPAPVSGEILGVVSKPTSKKVVSASIANSSTALQNIRTPQVTSSPTPTATPSSTPTPSVTPSPTDNAKLIFDFESGKVFDTKKPAFSGKATPNTDIEVEVSPAGKKMRVKSDTKGDWLVMMSDELANGDYKVSAFVIRADGSRGQEFGPIEFKVDVKEEIKKDRNLNNMMIGVGAAVLAFILLAVLLKNKKRFGRK